MTFSGQCQYAGGPQCHQESLLRTQNLRPPSAGFNETRVFHRSVGGNQVGPRPKRRSSMQNAKGKMPLTYGLEASVILRRRGSLKFKLKDTKAFDIVKTQSRQNLDMPLYGKTTGLILEPRPLGLNEIPIQ